MADIARADFSANASTDSMMDSTVTGSMVAGSIPADFIVKDFMAVGFTVVGFTVVVVINTASPLEGSCARYLRDGTPG
jgi:hypothetical protein